MLEEVTSIEQPLEVGRAMIPRYVVIANPDSKRWLAYEPELLAFWRGRGIEPELHLVPWNSIISHGGQLDGLSAFDRPAIVRLESPGRNWEVSRLLLTLGARVQGLPHPESFREHPYEKGRLVEPRLFYEGFRAILTRLQESFQDRPQLHVTSNPLAVAEMFDKNATCQRLAEAELPIPQTRLPPPEDGPALLTALEQVPWRTTYVKLNTGSSASAIVVVTHSGGLSGQSSVVAINDGFYSSRRLGTYHGEALTRVLGFLAEQGVCLQQGIRMATVEGRNFDVRVVCIHGRPRVTIFRLSWLPMTNLHLGGKRGDWAACRAVIPTRAWLDALDHCEEAARLYPCESVGIDLLFEAGFHRHYLLEVNAFGDFFPGLTDNAGRSIAAIELEETARSLGWWME